MKELLKGISISKKTAIIASTLVVLVAAPIVYLVTQDSAEVKSWYSSSWLYRKAVTVTNPGTALTNEDVLIQIDTQSLITAGKLQSDCDDLRFVDSDDTTALNYWVEGGCNTTTTQVWVRIPSVPNGDKTIYTYYGNSTATNGEQTWTGSFYMFADNSCSNGWTRDSNFDSRFIMGSSTSGNTGGTSGSHGGSFSVTSQEGSSVESGDLTDTYFCLADTPHAHTVSGTYGTSDSTPRYRSSLICSNSRLTTLDSLIMISDTSTPTGWTRFTGFDSMLPFGSNTYGTTGGNTSHTHSLSSVSVQSTASTICQFYETPGMESMEAALSTHTHTVSATSTDTAYNTPPSINLLYIKAPSSLPALNQQVIVMTSAIPPLGWSSYTAANDRFIYGSTTPSTTTVGSTIHSDHFLTSSASGSATLLDYFGVPVYNVDHTHGVSITNSNIPPYRTVVYAKRKISLTNTIGTEQMDNNAPTAPTTPYVEGQTNPVGVTDLTPEFSAIFNDADTGDTGVYYEIEVNRQSNFDPESSWWSSGQQSMTATAIGTRSPEISYTSGSPLSLDGSTYYWRIRFTDNKGGVSPWSTTAQFTMASTPAAPTSLLTEGQTNPTDLTDMTPEFSAIYNDSLSENTATYYEININTNSTFTGTVMWNTGQVSMTPLAQGTRSSDISYAGTALTTNGITYYWRIRFTNNSGIVGEWSTTAQFSMVNIPQQQPSAPTNSTVDGLSSPATISSSQPKFQALHTDINSDSAIYYEIEVNSNSSFAGTVMWDTGQQAISPVQSGTLIPEITYGGTALVLNSTYYWRIRVWDNNPTPSNWSTTQSFTFIEIKTLIEGMGLEGINFD